MLKYAFLTPRWRVLRAYDLELGGDRRSNNYDDTITTGGVSVHVPPPGGWSVHKSIREHCQTLRDALELIFLLSVVDRTAFVEMACGHWRGDVQPKQVERALPHEKEEDDTGTVRCRVELHGANTRWTRTNETHEWLRTAMDTMLTPQRLQDRTQSFRAARHKLVSVDSRQALRLEISIGIDAHKAIVPKLSLLMHSLAHSPRLEGNGVYPFQEGVVDVQTDLDSGSLTQLDACLRDTGHSRLHLGNVTIHTKKFTEQVAYGHQLSVLLRPSVERVPTTAAPTTPGRSLEPATPAHPLLLRQLCSALMYCQGIDSLTVNWGPGDRHATPQVRLQQMEWIAVALFSPWASHGIRHVHLCNFKVRGNECEDLRQLLHHPNPMASLLDVPFAQSNGQVLVAKHTEVWMQNLTSTRPCKSVRLADTSWLDVVAYDEHDVEHCDVLVPAYGVCRLRRADTTGHRPHTARQSLDRKLAISSLVLDVGCMGANLQPDQQDGLCAFFELVGAPLQKLTVVHMHNFASCLDAVWLHCRSLQCLQLTNASDLTLVALLDGYEAGVCRVTCLDLPRLFVPHDCTSIVAFFEMLADPARAISQTLRKLTFGLERGFGRYKFTRDEARAVAQMLESNTTLVSGGALCGAPRQVAAWTQGTVPDTRQAWLSERGGGRIWRKLS